MSKCILDYVTLSVTSVMEDLASLIKMSICMSDENDIYMLYCAVSLNIIFGEVELYKTKTCDDKRDKNVLMFTY